MLTVRKCGHWKRNCWHNPANKGEGKRKGKDHEKTVPVVDRPSQPSTRVYVPEQAVCYEITDQPPAPHPEARQPRASKSWIFAIRDEEHVQLPQQLPKSASDEVDRTASTINAIQSGGHKALIDSGACLAGPCLGDRLSSVAVTLDGRNQVVLTGVKDTSPPVT